MTKISYDSNYFEQKINPNVNDAISYLNEARKYLNDISVPSDFSRRKELNEVISDVYDEKNDLNKFMAWTTTTKNSYTRAIEDYKKNLNNIDTSSIDKRVTLQ